MAHLVMFIYHRMNKKSWSWKTALILLCVTMCVSIILFHQYCLISHFLILIKQEGRTAFMIASWWGHLKSAVELLSVAGADGHTHNQVRIYGIL